jgi:hypothetical protein
MGGLCGAHRGAPLKPARMQAEDSNGAHRGSLAIKGYGSEKDVKEICHVKLGQSNVGLMIRVSKGSCAPLHSDLRTSRFSGRVVVIRTSHGSSEQLELLFGSTHSVKVNRIIDEWSKSRE